MEKAWQKDLTVGVLNEIYGKFLTARQSEIVSQYYDYDLSLQEITENLRNITSGGA